MNGKTFRNESAHPVTEYLDNRPVGCSEGLTKREAFAMAAMQGIAERRNAKTVAAAAVDLADALIAELNKC